MDDSAGIDGPLGTTITIQTHQPPISGMTGFNPLSPLTTALIEYSLWTIPALIGLVARRALLPGLKDELEGRAKLASAEVLKRVSPVALQHINF